MLGALKAPRTEQHEFCWCMNSSAGASIAQEAHLEHACTSQVLMKKQLCNHCCYCCVLLLPKHTHQVVGVMGQLRYIAVNLLLLLTALPALLRLLHIFLCPFRAIS